MSEIKLACKILAATYEKKKSLARPRRRGESNTNSDTLIEAEFEKVQ